MTSAKRVLLLLAIAAPGMFGTPAVHAQQIIEGGTSRSGTVQTPPSVDNGLANGDVKHAGAPSVGNGIANGIVKQPGAPSVDNGVANGSVKSTTVNQ